MKKRIYKTKFGRIGFILLLILFISCNTKKTENSNNPENVIVPKAENEVNSDMMSYIMQTERDALVDESKIPRIKKLDEIEEKLKLCTTRVRDSIMNTVDTSKLTVAGSTEYKDILKKAMKDGDEESYYILKHENQIKFPNYFYISEKYGFAVAYSHIYEYFISMNMSKLESTNKEAERRATYTLDNLNKDYQNLALYALIKGFKKGDIHNAQRISLYFKEGLYFAKDNEIANELDSLYKEYKKTGLRN